MLNFTSRCVTPRNCSLAIGIPSSYEAFSDSLTRPYRSFAKAFFGGWTRYESEVMVGLTELIKIARDLHVFVNDTLTRADLANLFSDPERSVVILVTHWDKRQLAIELNDGFAGIDEFVAAVSPNFRGFLDLPACRPEQLTTALRLKRPGCLTRYVNKENTPSIWMAFYSILLPYIAQKHITYLQALEDVVSAMMT